MSDFQLTRDMFSVNMAQSHRFFSKSHTHQSVYECKNFTNVLLIYVFYMVRLHCELFLGFTPFISTTSLISFISWNDTKLLPYVTENISAPDQDVQCLTLNTQGLVRVFSPEILVLFLSGILMIAVNVIALKVVIKHSEENLE